MEVYPSPSLISFPNITGTSNNKIYCWNIASNTEETFSIKEINRGDVNDFIIVKDSIFLIGGKNRKTVYSINLNDNHDVIRKADTLVHLDKSFSISLKELFIYTICNNAREANCQKYDIMKDKWYNLPKLNIPRNYVSLSVVDDRFIYVLEGWKIGQSPSNVIERLDTFSEEDGWVIMRDFVGITEIEDKLGSWIFQCSNNSLIICGGISLSSGANKNIYNMNFHTKCITLQENMEFNSRVLFCNQTAIYKGKSYYISCNGKVNPTFDFYKYEFASRKFSMPKVINIIN